MVDGMLYYYQLNPETFLYYRHILIINAILNKKVKNDLKRTKNSNSSTCADGHL